METVPLHAPVPVRRSSLLGEGAAPSPASGVAVNTQRRTAADGNIPVAEPAVEVHPTLQAAFTARPARPAPEPMAPRPLMPKIRAKPRPLQRPLLRDVLVDNLGVRLNTVPPPSLIGRSMWNELAHFNTRISEAFFADWKKGHLRLGSTEVRILADWCVSESFFEQYLYWLLYRRDSPPVKLICTESGRQNLLKLTESRKIVNGAIYIGLSRVERQHFEAFAVLFFEGAWLDTVSLTASTVEAMRAQIPFSPAQYSYFFHWLYCLDDHGMPYHHARLQTTPEAAVALMAWVVQIGQPSLAMELPRWLIASTFGSVQSPHVGPSAMPG